MDIKELKAAFEAILKDELPNFVWGVEEYNGFGTNNDTLKIWMACSNKNINDVAGQKVQICSLLAKTNFEFHPQVFCGNGGRSIYRKPNLNDDKEKYLAMKSIILPFRTPKKDYNSVGNALIKFCRNYKATIAENIDNLMYQDLVDYKALVK